MAVIWFFALAVSQPAPAATAAPAPQEQWAPAPIEPTPAAPAQDLSVGFSSPSAIQFQTSTVHRPRYGLGISSVSVDRGPEKYQLHVKTWNEIVRDDPDLSHWSGQSHMLGGGIALTAIGGSWLAISAALSLDGIYARSAVGGLFQWVVPATMLTSGAIMTMVAVRARRKLRNEQRRLFAAPYAAAGQGGVAVSGRF